MTDHTHRWTHETPRVRPDGTRIAQGEALSPTAHEQRVWPDRLETLDESETCTEILESGDREGEPCGRDLPCPFHSDDGSEGTDE